MDSCIRSSMTSVKARRASGRKSSPHPKPSACMAFIIANAAGKDFIVTACGIGGAPSVDLSNPPEYPLSPLTQDSVRHRLPDLACAAQRLHLNSSYKFADAQRVNLGGNSMARVTRRKFLKVSAA